MTSHILRRFVADGLRATLDSYTTGTLPLHRFAWELHARLAALDQLTTLPNRPTLHALRTAQRAIADVDHNLRLQHDRDQLSASEQHTLAQAMRTLRELLDRLDPTDPTDPVAPARPAPAAIAPTSNTRSANARSIRHLRLIA